MKNYILIIVLSAMAMPIVYAKDNSTAETKKNINDEKPLYWIDPMEPTIHYPGPRKSRMNMDLIPIYSDDNQKAAKKEKE